MILVKQNGDNYEIRFGYNTEIIDLVKNTPGRMWHPEEKFWSIPKARLGFLIAQFRGTKYEKELNIQSNEDINVNASIDEPNAIPDIDVSDVTWYAGEGCQVFNHQKDLIKFAKWRYLNGLKSGFILADEMGAGKTLETMNWAMYMKEHFGAKHCLIIACVNSAKYNWREDIIKHTKGKEVPYILGTRKKRDKSLRLDTGSKEKLEDLRSLKMYGKDEEDLPYFIILNIEAIRAKEGKKFAIADRIIELINTGQIAIIALDEVHKNCLEYDTFIQTEQGIMKIGYIVDHKLEAKVLSYDVDSDKLIYKPIIGWHKTPTGSRMIELAIEENHHRRTIRCTADHEFYTKNRGWVAASDLTEYDDIVLKKGCDIIDI